MAGLFFSPVFAWSFCVDEACVKGLASGSFPDAIVEFYDTQMDAEAAVDDRILSLGGSKYILALPSGVFSECGGSCDACGNFVVHAIDGTSVFLAIPNVSGADFEFGDCDELVSTEATIFLYGLAGILCGGMIGYAFLKR